MIKEIIRGDAGTRSRVFDWIVQLSIIVSLIALTIETLPNLPARLRLALQWIEIYSISFFALEYALRTYAAPKPSQYVFSFWGVLDFVAFAPSILFAGVDMRALRALRLLRLIRILKLARHSKALTRLFNAVIEVRSELAVFGFLAFIILFISGTGIYYFERDAQPENFASIPHSLWWAVSTLTTVGYGDLYPITAGGKIFAFFIMILGLGVVAVPTGLIATALSNDTNSRRQDHAP